jgi:hypothetical protein
LRSISGPRAAPCAAAATLWDSFGGSQHCESIALAPSARIT